MGFDGVDELNACTLSGFRQTWISVSGLHPGLLLQYLSCVVKSTIKVLNVEQTGAINSSPGIRDMYVKSMNRPVKVAMKSPIIQPLNQHYV